MRPHEFSHTLSVLVIVALLATFDHAAHARQSLEPTPRHLIPTVVCTSSAGQHPDPRPDSTGPKNLYLSPWVAPFTWPGSSVPFALFGGVSIEKRIPIRATELMGLSAGIGYMGNNDVDPLRGITLVLQGVIMRRLSRTGTTTLISDSRTSNRGETCCRSPQARRSNQETP